MDGSMEVAGSTTAGGSPKAAGLDPAFWNRSLFEALVDANARSGGPPSSSRTRTGNR